MLTNWLSDDENKLPPNASHQIGVGCVVFNDEGFDLHTFNIVAIIITIFFVLMLSA
jgi:hypothetical protein